jgi:SAM-dependent methyltransferase
MAKQKKYWIQKNISSFEHEAGFAYLAKVNPRQSSHRRPSPALLLENDVILGSANSAHSTIRERGEGTYSFWHNTLYFSSSDNSNPSENGRIYEIAYPANLWDNIKIFFMKLGLLNVNGKMVTLDEVAGYRHLEKEFPKFEKTQWVIDLLGIIGIEPTRQDIILDFGCGVGESVKLLQDAGYVTYGCDVVFPSEKDTFLTSSLEKGTIRLIQQSPYRVPFEENCFDIVFSFQVLEHVMDYDSVLSEISRVLKPGGFSVHIFPGRYKFIEPHIYVPLATIIRNYWWLYLWALLGIRNEYQAGLAVKEIASSNFKYLHEHTVYFTRKQITYIVNKYFSHSYFCEEAYFRHLRTPLFIRYPFLLPLFRSWLSDTNTRILVTRK